MAPEPVVGSYPPVACSDTIGGGDISIVSRKTDRYHTDISVLTDRLKKKEIFTIHDV